MSDSDRTTPGGQAGPAASPETDVDRRGFLSTASSAAMAGGLVASYGTFAVMAGRYLYPTGKSTTWMFVAPVDSIPEAGALNYVTPDGLHVSIKRVGQRGAGDAATGEDFIALSSTCPHLGCRVHWEPQNNRFFCPCHNGAFDAEGNPIAGPPQKDNQHLPEYPLMVDRGLLYIEIPIDTVTGDAALRVAGGGDASAGPRRTGRGPGGEMVS